VENLKSPQIKSMKVAKMSEADLRRLQKRAKRDKTGILSHLLTCYYTMFENVCNPNSEIIEFKPEIIAAMEAYKNKVN
jgi:hypothetical protein